MLLLLVSFSRGGEKLRASNQVAEAQRTFQSSSDHSKPPSLQSVMTSEYQIVAHGDEDHTGGQQPAGASSEERSVLPPNDGSVPDLSGRTRPAFVPDSIDSGVGEKLGAKITCPIYFTDSTGKQVDICSLMTVPVLIVPVYYSCTSVCGILLSSISGALPDVQLTPVKDYRILTVSINDSEKPDLAAQRKKEYLKTVLQRDPSFPLDAWSFFTGDKQNIDALMDELGFHYKAVKKDFEHTIVAIVLSPEGKVVRYLYGVNLRSRDLTLALTESDTNASIFSGKRIAQTCYAYDSEKKTYVVDSILVSEVMLLVLILILGLYLLLGGKK